MDQRTALITLADTLAMHRGVSHFAISMRCMGKGDFFKNMKDKGWDCRTRTADRVLEWFDKSWPVDLQWPADIKRPSKQGRAA